jgi:formylglycine-generating enzyme required for sulfatase activity
VSAKTGKTYRLPTEAEWLLAAQLAAGQEPLNTARTESLAWHRGNSSKRTHPVGKRTADALGLYDLFGNAAEWVVTDDGKLVTRGGSFRDAIDKVGPNARAEQDDSWNERDPQLPKSRWWLSDGPFVGFRLVRNP